LTQYSVTMTCPRCGRSHLVGTRSHKDPASLAQLLGDLVWCDQAADYVELDSVDRLEVRPLPEPKSKIGP